jgi:cell fate (sporulation/competence/biofilm development) regulator YmcA (YheA/YmcA/DUF963 family)
MEAKQVNIAVPMKLYNKIEEYVEEYGYRNAQDLFLELARQKVIFENVDNLPLREEFVKKILDINKEENYLSVEESEKFHNELEKKAGLENEKKGL